MAARRSIAAAALPLALFAWPALAAPSAELSHAQAVARGRAIARQHCATCHEVEESGKSRSPLAPPFAALSPSEPLNVVVGAITSGASTGHPMMPNLSLSTAETRDLVAFMRSLRPDARDRAAPSGRIEN